VYSFNETTFTEHVQTGYECTKWKLTQTYI